MDGAHKFQEIKILLAENGFIAILKQAAVMAVFRLNFTAYPVSSLLMIVAMGMLPERRRR
jgi:hypothetical protein